MRATGLQPEEVFGKVLRALRKERSLSQEELAFEAELNRQFVSLIELGQRSPSLGTIYKLAQGLGLTGSELLSHVESHFRAASKGKRRQ